MTNDHVTPIGRRRTAILVLMVVALAALAACGDSDDPTDSTVTTLGIPTTTAASSVTSVPATSAGSIPLRAVLTGTAEVPGPGDRGARGNAVIVVDPAKSEVCWEITAVALSPAADKAHIHRGVAAQAGDVVVTLSPPAGRGGSSGCAAADPALVTELTGSPEGFYVNLHNATYPNGAIRGQLTKAG